jgi:YHS domain-containing protein
MNPLRILVLLLLFYVLYRLLKSGTKRGGKYFSRAGKAKAPPADDILEEDPVCHTYIPRGQAIQLKEKGTTRYFCSDSCRDKYIEIQKSSSQPPPDAEQRGARPPQGD